MGLATNQWRTASKRLLQNDKEDEVLALSVAKHEDIIGALAKSSCHGFFGLFDDTLSCCNE